LIFAKNFKKIGLFWKKKATAVFPTAGQEATGVASVLREKFVGFSPTSSAQTMPSALLFGVQLILMND